MTCLSVTVFVQSLLLVLVCCLLQCFYGWTVHHILADTHRSSSVSSLSRMSQGFHPIVHLRSCSSLQSLHIHILPYTDSLEVCNVLGVQWIANILTPSTELMGRLLISWKITQLCLSTLYHLLKYTHILAGHENSTHPIALMSGFGYRVSGDFSSVKHFSCFYHSPIISRTNRFW